jgi:hypothetical protein
VCERERKRGREREYKMVNELTLIRTGRVFAVAKVFLILIPNCLASAMKELHTKWEHFLCGISILRGRQ